jgi:hypothetical protein
MINIRSLPKEKLQPIALIAVFSLIAIVFVWRLYVQKQIDFLCQSNRQIRTLQDQLKNIEQQKLQRELNEQMRQKMQAFVEAQSATMVSGDPLSWAVRQISLFAENRPVHVVAIRPTGKGSHPRKPKFEVFNLRLDLEGTYDQLGGFVSDLENTFASASIGSLELSGSDGSAHRMSIDLSFLVAPANLTSEAKTPQEAKKML